VKQFTRLKKEIAGDERERIAGSEPWLQPRQMEPQQLICQSPQPTIGRRPDIGASSHQPPLTRGSFAMPVSGLTFNKNKIRLLSVPPRF